MKSSLARKLSLVGVVLGVFMLLALVLSFTGARPAEAALGGWTLQWSDEFSGSGGVNTGNWLYDLGHGYGCSSCWNWGTGEIENMTNSTANVYQSGGYLYIKPIRDGSGNWTSGRIETQRTDFQPPSNGAMAIEARIQQPNVSGAAAQGYWPAFWMLGAPFRGVYTNWPSVGEIDILEDPNGQSLVFSTLHCGYSPGGPCNETTGIGSGGKACNGCQTGMHTYRMEFDKSVSPQQLRWYLDGNLYFTVKSNQVDTTTWNNATNHGFFIILNVAMGGSWPGSPTGSTASGVPMVIDYVRVYYASQGGTNPTATRTPTNGTGPTATRTPTTRTGPTATVPAGTDFTQGVTSLNSTQAKIWFKPATTSAWVDVHYLINGANQQNIRMTNNAGTWEQTVSNLAAGTTIEYWFTYEKSGLAYDTGHYTYKHGGAATNLVTNAGFEAGASQTPAGWGSWSASGATDADYSENYGTAHGGTYHLTHWRTSAYDVETYQLVKGLANGQYTLKAWVKAGGTFTTKEMEVKLYGGADIRLTIPATNNWTQIAISNINVTNGQAQIGFYTKGSANAWVYMDDVEFYKQ